MKLLIFDIDGTLTATNDVDTVYFTEALIEFFGFSDFDTNWENYDSVTDSGILEAVARKHWNRSLTKSEEVSVEKRFISRLRKEPVSSFSPLYGANEFIQFLRGSQQYKVALATGCWKSSSIYKLEKATIDYGGIPMATSSDSSDRVSILEQARVSAINHYGIEDFDEIIYFGDAVWDVRACESLNWRMIGMGAAIDQLEAVGQNCNFRDFRFPAKIIEAIEDSKTNNG